MAIEGVIVDDPAHPEEIERRVREVLGVIFDGRTDAIVDEVREQLRAKLSSVL
jgi:hypothetical protein